MDEKQKGMALTIKACLDSLKDDATRNGLEDLARFIGLAALAAEEAAMMVEGRSLPPTLITPTTFGHC